MAAIDTAIAFVVSWIISAVIIFVVAKLFGEKEGFGTAAISSLIGAVIYAIAYYALGAGLLAAVIGGIAWLIALGTMYKMGWLKSLLVAIVVWVFASLVGALLPTVVGPL